MNFIIEDDDDDSKGPSGMSAILMYKNKNGQNQKGQPTIQTKDDDDFVFEDSAIEEKP